MPILQLVKLRLGEIVEPLPSSELEAKLGFQLAVRPEPYLWSAGAEPGQLGVDRSRL